MKNYLLILFISLIFLLIYSCTKQAEQIQVSESQKQEMRKSAKDFLSGLRSVLIREIQSGGVVNAVTVCSDSAQILTNQFGLERGVFIRRVSYKNRNQNNHPDEYESGILSQFEHMKQNGELTENSESIQIVREGDFTYLKYMKPIFVQAECLTCHGNQEQIDQSTKMIIGHKYPNDKAFDYSAGDLRGAVSVKKLIE
jgi:hypothetical protein